MEEQSSPSGFKVGDRVRTTHTTAHYVSIPEGTTGTVTYASSVSHATYNGGGFDVRVELDDERIARAINGALHDLATRSAFYTPEFIARNARNVAFRSTDLAKEA